MKSLMRKRQALLIHKVGKKINDLAKEFLFGILSL